MRGEDRWMGRLFRYVDLISGLSGPSVTADILQERGGPLDLTGPAMLEIRADDRRDPDETACSAEPMLTYSAARLTGRMPTADKRSRLDLHKPDES